MALVQYTAVVNQLRGKLNGSVFNKMRTGYTLQRKQAPPRGARGNQQQWRSAYSFIQRRWRMLSPSQQQSWQTTANSNPSVNRFGDNVSLAGYNQYIKANLFARLLGLTERVSGYANPAPSAEITGLTQLALDLSVSPAGHVIVASTVDWAYTATASGFYVIADLSLPQSTGVTSQGKGWRFLWGATLQSSAAIGKVSDLGLKYPSTMPGQRLFLRLRIIHANSGAVVFTYIEPILIAEAPEITSWDVVFNGMGVPSDFTIDYLLPTVGVPSFYSIQVRFTPAMATVPVPADATSLAAGVSAALATSNSTTDFISVAPGFYIGYRVDIIFTQTGEIVATAFDVVTG